MEINYAQDVTGRTKLEAVAEAWNLIQTENVAQKKYVSASDWKTWDDYDKEVVVKLTSIVERYNGRSLSVEDNATLDQIIKNVGGTKRVTEQEFVDREIARIAAAEAEREKKQAAKEIEAKRAEEAKELNTFKSKLKGLFGKKN